MVEGEDVGGTARTDCDLRASDEIALGVLEEARRRFIRIPQELSVVGLDDAFLAGRPAPPHTTLAQPLLEWQTITGLNDHYDVRSTRHMELVTRLAIRDSTAPHDCSKTRTLTRHPLLNAIGPESYEAFLDPFRTDFFTESYAAYLADLDANAMRIPISYRHFESAAQPKLLI